LERIGYNRGLILVFFWYPPYLSPLLQGAFLLVDDLEKEEYNVGE